MFKRKANLCSLFSFFLIKIEQWESVQFIRRIIISCFVLTLNNCVSAALLSKEAEAVFFFLLLTGITVIMIVLFKFKVSLVKFSKIHTKYTTFISLYIRSCLFVAFQCSFEITKEKNIYYYTRLCKFRLSFLILRTHIYVYMCTNEK